MIGIYNGYSTCKMRPCPWTDSWTVCFLASCLWEWGEWTQKQFYIDFHIYIYTYNHIYIYTYFSILQHRLKLFFWHGILVSKINHALTFSSLTWAVRRILHSLQSRWCHLLAAWSSRECAEKSGWMTGITGCFKQNKTPSDSSPLNRHRHLWWTRFWICQRCSQFPKMMPGGRKQRDAYNLFQSTIFLPSITVSCK